MLRVNTSTSASGARKYFAEELSQGDYYLGGQEIGAQWQGKAAEFLGLSGKTVTEEAFGRLAEGLHPETGEDLTARRGSNRRVGYDFTFSVPKSVSVVQARAAAQGDESILRAFHEAVHETMQEIESAMQTRVRRGGQERDRTTGNMIWGEFTHLTSRPVDGVPDPHLHAHCFAFNATYDQDEGKWKAGQFGALKRDAPYYEAAFDARLAEKLVQLGYQVERKPAKSDKAWEIAGVPDSVIEKFSRRTTEIEKEAAEKKIVSEKLKAELGAETRETKSSALEEEKGRASWNSRLTAEEETALQAVESKQQKIPSSQTMTADDALEHALSHVFERRSVISEKRLLEEALRRGVGQVSVSEVQQAASEHESILRSREEQGREVTTKEVLAEEQSMIAFARDGKSSCAPLGQKGIGGDIEFDFEVGFLNREQKEAVRHVLRSEGKVVIVSGGAGVGKTTLMKEAIRGIEEGGHDVFTFAPTAAAAREVLPSEGFENAETVARLLIDEKLQSKLAGQVIWIDEAGLLGSRTMNQVFEIANDKNARVILAGDERQHAAVERGDALRILREQVGIKVAEVRKIQRQRGEYREAVEAISKGEIEKGFNQLEELDAILEMDEEHRHEALAGKYCKAVLEDKKTALVVSPTHAEGEKVTASIRGLLKEAKALGAEDRSFLRLRKLQWTEAQKCDAKNYQPGMVVEFQQNAKDFTGKVPMLGMNPKGNVTVVKEFEPHEREFKLQYDFKGDVNVVGTFKQRGITRGEKFVVIGHDQQGNVQLESNAGGVKLLPVDQAKKFQVYEGQEVGLAKGDKIRITKNGSTPDKKHRLHNGSIYEVKGFTSKGDIRLNNNWVVSKDYGHLTHGYCTTSHASQGKTVDRVFIAQGAKSFPASSMEQFYVSVSRGRESVQIFTDDKEGLLEAVTSSAARKSASEIAREDQESKQGTKERLMDTLIRAISEAEEARACARQTEAEILDRYGLSDWERERQTVLRPDFGEERPEVDAVVPREARTRAEVAEMRGDEAASSAGSATVQETGTIDVVAKYGGPNPATEEVATAVEQEPGRADGAGVEAEVDVVAKYGGARPGGPAAGREPGTEESEQAKKEALVAKYRRARTEEQQALVDKYSGTRTDETRTARAKENERRAEKREREHDV
jgi:conjugative relaxase-like TrwC/TraI family protein